MGDELRNSAIWALAFTLVLIVHLHRRSAFTPGGCRSAPSSRVLHDPILVLGVFSITQTPFDLAVVAAILAVIGYSLNDTVIVFDRIRERFEANRRLPPAVALDQSINQTLSRTIMTKVVTLDRGRGAAVPRRPGAARLLRGAADRHPGRHVFVDLHLERRSRSTCGLKAEHVFPTVTQRPPSTTAVSREPRTLQ